jgi:hypothetical protein
MSKKQFAIMGICCLLLQLAAGCSHLQTANPPESAKAIIRHHQEEKAKATKSPGDIVVLLRSDFNPEELRQLDAFAADVSGHKGTRVGYIGPCGSCKTSGQSDGCLVYGQNPSLPPIEMCWSCSH